MTISDKAVEAACAAFFDDWYTPHAVLKDDEIRSDMRRAIEAALNVMQEEEGFPREL